jgi:hypothetical protein
VLPLFQETSRYKRILNPLTVLRICRIALIPPPQKFGPSQEIDTPLPSQRRYAAPGHVALGKEGPEKDIKR